MIPNGFAIGKALRDLVGAAAAGAAATVTVLMAWLTMQFGRLPSLEKADSLATTLLAVLVLVYVLLWIARAGAENSASARAPTSKSESRFLAPFIQASGNAVFAVAAADILARVASVAINYAALHVGGYFALLGLLLLPTLARTYGRAS